MATATIGALANLGSDFGEAQVENRKLDLTQQNIQSEIEARKAAADIQRGQLAVEQARQQLTQSQAGINYKDPSTGQWKRYDPVSMKITELPAGFDPTYNPSKDPAAILKRAESAYGGPLPDAVKQRLIAGATDVHLPTTSALKQEPDKGSNTGWSWVRRDAEGNEVSRSIAPPPAGFIPRESTTTQTDPLGATTTTHTIRKPIVAGVGTPTAAPTALASVVKGANSAPVTTSSAPAAAGPHTAPENVKTIPNVAADGVGHSNIDIAKLTPLERNLLPMAQQWSERGIKPPEKYVGLVQNLMGKLGVVPFTEETAAYKNARSAIRDVLPILETLKKDLEPEKDDNNLFFGEHTAFDARKNWFKYSTLGQKNEDPIQAEINQLASFSQIAASAPWSKVGRGKYIYEKVQLHLPDASKDTGANLYDKTVRLLDLFQAELQRSPSKVGVDNWATGTDTPALKSVINAAKAGPQAQSGPQAQIPSNIQKMLDEADQRIAAAKGK